MTSTLKNDLPRVDYIEGVRGVAAFLVFLNHLGFLFGVPSSWTTSPALGMILDSISNGAVPVSLFYMMSGYVLSLKYFLRNDIQLPTDKNYSRFALARLTRLYYPFVVAIILSVIFKSYIYTIREVVPALDPDGSSRWMFELTWPKFIQDVLLQSDPVGPALLPQAWFLPYEICFNLLLPFLVWIATRRTRNLVYISLAMLFLLASSPSLLYFVAGVLAAKHHNKVTGWGKRMGSTKRLLIGLIGAIWANFEPVGRFLGTLNGTEFTYDQARTLALPGLLALGFFIFTSRTLHKILCFRPFLAFGKISYSFYLTHWMILITMGSYLIQTIKANWGLADVPTLQLASVILFAVSLPYSILFYFMVEAPAHKLARQIAP